MARTLAGLSGLLLAGTLAACAGDASTTPHGAAAVTSLTIAPSSLVLQVGQTLVLTASALDAAGHPVTDVTVSWSSNALSVASIATTGAVTGVSAGSAVVTAVVGTRTTTLSITVIPSVRRVSVSPPTPNVEMGTTLQMSLTLLDQLENQINVVVPVTWTSGSDARATVSATGLVTPHDTGAVTITGSLSTGGVAPLTASTTVTVVPHIAVVSVEVLPNPMGLIGGQARTLSAFAHAQNGAVIVGRTFTWSSQGPAIAAVTSTGIVTGLLAGAAQISAVSEGIAGSAGVTVFAPTSAPGVGVAFTANSIVSQFVTIPAGQFVMGSPNANLDERPVRTVTLTAPFKMQKTEVTRGQWVGVMGQAALPPGNTGCDFCPVTGVTWDQAQTFINNLNALFPGNGFRLPTEAQWEYAARATTTASTPGPLELIAEYFVTSEGHVWPVALRQPNVFGLYDVIGNAAEWTADWYVNSYDPNQLVDPTGPVSPGTRRVDRGGAFASTAFFATSSYRSGSPVEQIGLRLVRN